MKHKWLIGSGSTSYFVHFKLLLFAQLHNFESSLENWERVWDVTLSHRLLPLLYMRYVYVKFWWGRIYCAFSLVCGLQLFLSLLVLVGNIFLLILRFVYDSSEIRHRETSCLVHHLLWQNRSVFVNWVYCRDYFSKYLTSLSRLIADLLILISSCIWFLVLNLLEESWLLASYLI